MSAAVWPVGHPTHCAHACRQDMTTLRGCLTVPSASTLSSHHCLCTGSFKYANFGFLIMHLHERHKFHEWNIMRRACSSQRYAQYHPCTTAGASQRKAAIMHQTAHQRGARKARVSALILARNTPSAPRVLTPALPRTLDWPDTMIEACLR